MGKIISINSSTEEIYGEIDESSDFEIGKKVEKAISNREWALMNVNDRVNIILGLVDLLGERKEEIAILIAKEMGKVVKAGRHEIEITQKRVFDYCSLVPKFIEDEILFASNTESNIICFEPVGSVAVISPWNAPFFVSLASIIPALLCGNNVIWKPSEYTSFCGLKLAELFDLLKKRGLPDSAFQVVIGGKDIGRKLVESRINMTVLTGSIRAGKEVMKNSAERLKRFVLELGGKDPAIVLSDSNIDSAVKAIVKSATMYTGQVCFAVERVYCQESIYDEFVSKCVSEIQKLRVGDPLEEESDVGPFAVKFQRDKVLEHIRDAVINGAKILSGCHEIGGKGYFFAPGVVVNVNHTMKIMKEETFGPVIPIMKFREIDEAVKLANDSEYGLTASIWTSDLLKGEEIARKIEAGTVEINRHGMSKAGCPWGGYKQSGIGRIYSKEGVREFCNTKHVWVMK